MLLPDTEVPLKIPVPVIKTMGDMALDTVKPHSPSPKEGDALAVDTVQFAPSLGSSWADLNCFRVQ